MCNQICDVTVQVSSYMVVLVHICIYMDILWNCIYLYLYLCVCVYIYVHTHTVYLNISTQHWFPAAGIHCSRLLMCLMRLVYNQPLSRGKPSHVFFLTQVIPPTCCLCDFFFSWVLLNSQILSQEACFWLKLQEAVGCQCAVTPE